MYKEKKEFLTLYLKQGAKMKRLETMLLRAPERKSELLDELGRVIRLRQDIEERIEEIYDPVLKEILFLKYVCGKTLLEISYIINYSRRHTERLHLKALDEFEL